MQSELLLLRKLPHVYPILSDLLMVTNTVKNQTKMKLNGMMMNFEHKKDTAHI